YGCPYEPGHSPLETGNYATSSGVQGPCQPVPARGRETGIDVGLKVLLITAEREAVANPGHYRKAEKRLVKEQKTALAAEEAEQAVGASGGRRRRVWWRRNSRKAAANGAISTTGPPWHWCVSTTPATSKTCGSPAWYATRTWPRERQRCGLGVAPRHPCLQSSRRR